MPSTGEVKAAQGKRRRQTRANRKIDQAGYGIHSHSPDQRRFRCPVCRAKLKGAYKYRGHSIGHNRTPDLDAEEIIVDESKW